VKGRDAWQELDYAAVFGSMTKWAGEVDDAARMSELVSRAFHVATAGQPGPVVLALPHDVLVEPVNCLDAPPCQPVETSPGAPEMAALEALLGATTSPIVLLGGSRWDEPARAAGGHGIPPSAAIRSAAPQLRRRSGAFPQSCAAGARQGR
jgi:acetolactate synthase-1/2/3 large subunit